MHVAISDVSPGRTEISAGRATKDAAPSCMITVYKQAITQENSYR